MRKFLFRFFGFLLLVSFIFGSLQLFILTYPVKPFCCEKSEIMDVKSFYASNNSNSSNKFVFIGSSRVQEAIIKFTENDSVLNLGGYAQNLEFNYFVLKNLLSRSKPKAVFLEMNWFSFNTRRLNCNSNVIASLNYEFCLNDASDLLELLRHKNNFFFSSSRYHIEHKHKEPISVSKNKTDMNKEDLGYFYRVFPDGSAGIDKKQLSYFLKIIELARNNQVPLFVFTSPECESFMKIQHDQEYIMETIYKECQINKLKYIDLRNAINSKTNKPFKMSDSHHINRNESSQFTRQVLSEFGYF